MDKSNDQIKIIIHFLDGASVTCTRIRETQYGLLVGMGTGEARLYPWTVIRYVSYPLPEQIKKLLHNA
jgi:hypothetical protein